jgi:nitroreductase
MSVHDGSPVVDRLRRRWAAPTGMDLDVAELLVGAAVHAPSVHNTQPWRFVHDRDGGIELWADRSRLLPVTDPAGRQLVISCGAALAVLMVGVRWLGFHPLVSYYPAPADPALLARLAIGPPCRPSSQALDMLVVAAERHTHRGPFDDVPVAPSLLTELRRVAARGHCRVHFVRDVEALLLVTRLTATAEAEQRRAPAVRQELGDWLRPGEGPHRDGIPAAAAGVPHAGLGRLAPRRYGPATIIADQPRPGTGRLPATMVLSTRHDDVAAWLHAGVALQQMLLLAARHSVYASIHTQPVEIPAMRARLAALAGDPYPQMLLQLGHADSAPSATPRRPPSEVLTAR